VASKTTAQFWKAQSSREGSGRDHFLSTDRRIQAPSVDAVRCMARQAFVCDFPYFNPLYAELVWPPAQAHPLDISHQ
jgi:hypothetical protein